MDKNASLIGGVKYHSPVADKTRHVAGFCRFSSTHTVSTFKE